MTYRVPLMLSFLLLSTQPQAQVNESSDDSINGTRIVFSGYRWGSDHEQEVSIGFGLPVTGRLYNFSYADIGSFGSLNSELAYLINPVARVHVGVVAGPNVDWLNTPYGDELTSYLTGCAGGVVAVSLNHSVGVWGYGKYKFALDGETNYRNGYLAGVGLYVRY